MWLKIEHQGSQRPEVQQEANTHQSQPRGVVDSKSGLALNAFESESCFELLMIMCECEFKGSDSDVEDLHQREGDGKRGGARRRNERRGRRDTSQGAL